MQGSTFPTFCRGLLIRTFLTALQTSKSSVPKPPAKSTMASSLGFNHWICCQCQSINHADNFSCKFCGHTISYCCALSERYELRETPNREARDLVRHEAWRMFMLDMTSRASLSHTSNQTHQMYRETTPRSAKK
jgi:hypothetical protein